MIILSEKLKIPVNLTRAEDDQLCDRFCQEALAKAEKGLLGAGEETARAAEALQLMQVYNGFLMRKRTTAMKHLPPTETSPDESRIAMGTK